MPARRYGRPREGVYPASRKRGRRRPGPGVREVVPSSGGRPPSGAGLRGSRSGSMTALQLKELSQSGLYRRRRDRPDSLRLPGQQEQALR